MGWLYIASEFLMNRHMMQDHICKQISKFGMLYFTEPNGTTGRHRIVTQAWIAVFWYIN